MGYVWVSSYINQTYPLLVPFICLPCSKTLCMQFVLALRTRQSQYGKLYVIQHITYLSMFAFGLVRCAVPILKTCFSFLESQQLDTKCTYPVIVRSSGYTYGPFLWPSFVVVAVFPWLSEFVVLCHFIGFQSLWFSSISFVFHCFQSLWFSTSGSLDRSLTAIRCCLRVYGSWNAQSVGGFGQLIQCCLRDLRR